MKKKILPLTLAALMSFSGAMPAYAADGSWIKGWTGKEGGSDYSITETTDGFILSNDKVNNGKFTDGEDSIIYAAQKIAGDEDFTFSAAVSIDEYSVMEESSNPQQGSVGIAILDDTFNKTDSVAYTDNVFLGAYAPDKKTDPAICPIIRDNSDKKSVGDALSDSFKNEGRDLGTFNLSITKSGNLYTFDCDGKTYTAEVYNFEGDIYPCVYIARNVKATFGNVKLQVAAKKPTGITIKEAQTEYTYGESLKPVTAVVEYSDGTSEETNEVSVKGYKSETLGSQKLIVSKGSAKTELYVNVKPHVTKDIEVTYTPVKTSYAKNAVFSTQGMEVTAFYKDGSKEVLDPEDYTIKLGGKGVKDGDKLEQTGSLTAIVTRRNKKGYDGGSAAARFKVDVADKTVTELELTPPVKKTYYIGDDIDLSGMKVIAHYSDNTSELLEKRDYTVTGFNSDFKENGLKVTVTPVCGGASADFKIGVKERTAEKLVVTKYPRTTYSIGSEPDTELKAAILYDNGDTEETEAYTVDTSAIDTSTEGEYTLYVRPTDKNLDTVAIKVNVAEEKPHYWSSAAFGQSSGYKDPEKTGINADEDGTVNGKINIYSWGGAGKITNDHDGMNYYYTQV
ncbi:MAG: bacterial Ig-like domain-containing protein, partial [Firmicutes bacterium]|nr:bacterial Ig-like domain-containing protein [Bacillota bacterium]